jgi:fructose-1,6-bisphosphatase/inositol monophosphatase family enzyme
MIDIDAVTILMREAARLTILPRYRRLQLHEIIEKSPGELVTAADREAEAILSDSLPGLLPGSRVIGEEGCAASPQLLAEAGEGLVWLLDPLDGTANFAAGAPPFAVMLALLEHGVPIASWMLDPLSNHVCTALVGGGAWLNGDRVEVGAAVPDLGKLRGALISHFMSEELQGRIRERLAAVTHLPKLMCSGAEYPAVAFGERQLSLFWRTLAWDHVPGTLFLTEAGGHVSRLDGTHYRWNDGREGLIIAQNPGVAELVLAALAGVTELEAAAYIGSAFERKTNG